MYFREQNKAALALGASHYHDDMVLRQVWNGTISSHFARYYFNHDGLELAYFIPELMPFHEEGHLHVHPTPRVWGFEHSMIPLIEGIELT